MSAIVKNAEANNTALTVTIKPQGVTVKIGQEGYLTEAIIRKFYGCTKTLAASLVTGGVKLAKTPSLIRSEEQNPLELAAFFYRLQPLLQGGLDAIFSNKESLPNVPTLKSDVLWKKPMLKIQADMLAASFPKAFPKGQNVVPKAKAEEVPKANAQTEAESVPATQAYTDSHLKGCKHRLIVALRPKQGREKELARIFKHIGFTLDVPHFLMLELAALMYGRLTEKTLDAMKVLRQSQPNLVRMLSEVLVCLQQDLSEENIGEDEVALVYALKALGQDQGYDDAELASLLDTVIDILNAV